MRYSVLIMLFEKGNIKCIECDEFMINQYSGPNNRVFTLFCFDCAIEYTKSTNKFKRILKNGEYSREKLIRK